MEDRELGDLRERLKPICKRTLRRQVVEFIRFTNRIPFTQDFLPTEAEQKLYDLVTVYLQRGTLNDLPAGQRKLMTMVLRKLLASSTYAIAGTLEKLAKRLGEKHAAAEPTEDLGDFDGIDELADEWDDGEPAAESMPNEGIADLLAEIRELQEYSKHAAAITVNAKGEALLTALEKGFEKLSVLGAARKAVIFTESRRTQDYLIDLLGKNGYGGKILTINGINADDRSGTIYKDWVKRHAGESVVTGNKTVDLRAALVEHFRDRAEILIAIEAAAEGVNLQFCSLVVNYDLPWNPQRIEQRVGRCHRYGQKHDVAVINSLNRGNAADQRVFELLSEKFKLFDGVFGSSDEVLGALESGVDFERRIAEIYQNCRAAEEIDRAFAELRAELEQQIVTRMADTRTKLLDNFDEEVHQKLRAGLEESRGYLDRLGRWLWALSRHELEGVARFHESDMTFDLDRTPEGCDPVPPGRYQFATPGRLPDGDHAQSFRMGHPLAEYAIARAKERPLPVARVRFHLSKHKGKVGLLEDLVGRSGWMTLTRMTVKALEDEDRLVFAVQDDRGEPIEPEAAAKMFTVGGEVLGAETVAPEIANVMLSHKEHCKAMILGQIGERNNHFFAEQIDKFDRWADDLKNGLEMEIKNLDAEIKQVGKDARLAPDLKGKLELQRAKKDLEALRSKRQRALFDSQDKIGSRKDRLLAEVEAKLQQNVQVAEIFTIGWEVK